MSQSQIRARPYLAWKGLLKRPCAIYQAEDVRLSGSRFSCDDDAVVIEKAHLIVDAQVRFDSVGLRYTSTVAATRLETAGSAGP